MTADGDRHSAVMRRFGVSPPAAILILSTLIFSWLAMMVVHELGHVLHGWWSGGRIVKLVLHPLAISRTDVDPNPHPLFVVWGGPLWGCLLPIAAFVGAKRLELKIWPIAAFFAGFCLIANGAYLGVGSWAPVGDALDLRRLGTPAWALGLYGLSTISAGLWCWHGLAPHFGIGRRRLPVSWKSALSTALLAGLIVVAELSLSDRM